MKCKTRYIEKNLKVDMSLGIHQKNETIPLRKMGYEFGNSPKNKIMPLRKMGYEFGNLPKNETMP